MDQGLRQIGLFNSFTNLTHHFLIFMCCSAWDHNSTPFLFPCNRAQKRGPPNETRHYYVFCGGVQANLPRVSHLFEAGIPWILCSMVIPVVG